MAIKRDYKITGVKLGLCSVLLINIGYFAYFNEVLSWSKSIRAIEISSNNQQSTINGQSSGSGIQSKPVDTPSDTVTNNHSSALFTRTGSAHHHDSTKEITFTSSVKIQYEHFWDKHPQFQEVAHEKSTLQYRNSIRQRQQYTKRDVRLVEVTRRTPGLGHMVSLHVEETYKGDHTVGGSTFRALSQSDKWLVVCGFRDYFNGSYSIYCPAYGQKVNITVQSTQVDFVSFKGEVPILDTIIWQRDIAIEEDSKDQQYNFLGDSFVSEGLWAGQKQPTFWHKHHGNLSSIDRAALCQCVGNYSAWYMVGASHMGLQARYIHYLCGHDLLPDVTKIVIRLVPNYADAIIKKLNSIVDDIERTGDVTKTLGFAVQFGSWDLTFRGFRNTIENTVPSTIRKLATFIDRIAKYPGWKLVFSGPPCQPNRRGPKDHEGVMARNNEVSSVFNEHLLRACREFNISMVDAFSITYPLYRDTPPGGNHHYLNFYGPEPHYDDFKGRAGMAVAHTLYHRMCPQI